MDEESKDIIFSIFIGVVIACIIAFMITGKVIFKGPNSNDIKNEIYNKDGKCYMLMPVIQQCPIGAKHA
jgi:hypothetical protein